VDVWRGRFYNIFILLDLTAMKDNKGKILLRAFFLFYLYS